MATNKAVKQGNTDELERIEAQNEELSNIAKGLQAQNSKLKVDNNFLEQKCAQLEDALKKIQERNQVLEEANGITPEGEKIRSGNVVIATLPLLDTEIFPIPGKINGIPIPRKLEGGVLYETMPVKNAVAVLSEGSGFKRALVGPVTIEKIEGECVKHQVDPKFGVRGTYSKHVVYNRHKVVVGKRGPQFVEVVIEESKQKAD